MPEDEKPSGNGAPVTNWRLKKLEEKFDKLEEKVDAIHDAVITASAARLSRGQLIALGGTFVTVIGGIIVAIIQIQK